MTVEQERGPAGWTNWRAYAEGSESLGTFEYRCWTDAYVTGEVGELGPYRVINAIAGGERLGTARPAIVLRVDFRNDQQPLSPGRPEGSRDVRAFHGGSLDDEMAGLISLALGIRLKSGGETRRFLPGDDPKGMPLELPHRQPYLPPPGRHPQLPRVAEDVMLNDLRELLSLYPLLSATQAVALARAGRAYAQALWVADDDPNLAWLSLVGAIEPVAVEWKHAQVDDILALRDMHPRLVNRLERTNDADLVKDVARMLSRTTGPAIKFRQFLLAHLPDPPDVRPAFHRLDWDTGSLDPAFRSIYVARSLALHEGTPFPDPMCWPPIPIDDSGLVGERAFSLGAAGAGGSWPPEDYPMYLHTFAHIVGGALKCWWRNCAQTDAA